jgi:hypothetical protein
MPQFQAVASLVKVSRGPYIPCQSNLTQYFSCLQDAIFWNGTKKRQIFFRLTGAIPEDEKKSHYASPKFLQDALVQDFQIVHNVCRGTDVT